MRIAVLMTALIICTTMALAADIDASLSIDTGDAELNIELNNIDAIAADPKGAEEIRAEIVKDFGLSRGEILKLEKKGYRLAQIEYLAMLAKVSRKTTAQIIAMHNQGIGWGALAHKLGVHPSALKKVVRKHRVVKRTVKKAVKHEVKKTIRKSR